MCCGSRRQIGRDHVPPKVLFGRPLPSNLITVPACWRCNQIFSKDDEYFASILSIENSAHRQPQAAERWERFVRGLQRPRAAQFRTAFLKNLKPINLYTEGGVYLGRRGGVEINFDRIIRTVCRCVRGLYYPEEKRSIRENRKILTFAIEAKLFFAVILPSDKLNHPPRRLWNLHVSVRSRCLCRVPTVRQQNRISKNSYGKCAAPFAEGWPDDIEGIGSDQFSVPSVSPWFIC